MKENITKFILSIIILSFIQTAFADNPFIKIRGGFGKLESCFPLCVSRNVFNGPWLRNSALYAYFSDEIASFKDDDGTIVVGDISSNELYQILSLAMFPNLTWANALNLYKINLENLLIKCDYLGLDALGEKFANLKLLTQKNKKFLNFKIIDDLPIMPLEIVLEYEENSEPSDECSLELNFVIGENSISVIRGISSCRDINKSARFFRNGSIKHLLNDWKEFLDWDLVDNELPFDAPKFQSINFDLKPCEIILEKNGFKICTASGFIFKK